MATQKPVGTGAGVFDNTLMFKSSGTVTRGTTAAMPSSGLKIRGTGIHGLAARILFPAMPGTTKKILPQIQASWDDSTYQTIAQYEGGYLSAASGSLEVMVPFKTSYPYVKLIFAFAGATAATWGAVKAGIVEPNRNDWSRLVRWD